MRGLKLIFAAALLLTSCAAMFAQQTGKTVRKHRVAEESPVTLAENAIEKKDSATAEKLLREQVAQKADDYRAWFDLGFVLNAQGNTAEAVDAYKKSIAANSTIFESNLNLGRLLAKAGDSEAEKYLRAATQLKPSSPRPEQEWARAWLLLGHVLEKSNPNGAVEAFRAASKFAPRDPEPHISAATILESQKQFAAAEAEYKQAASIDPKSSDAMAGLVNVYTSTGRLSEAEPALRKYVALDPQNANAHIQLGRVLATLGRTEDAVTELQAGLQLSPNNPAATRALASLLIESNKSGEAEMMLRPLVEQNPNDAVLRHELGRALMHNRKFQNAQTELMAAIKLNPNLGEAYGDLAIVASESQNYPLTIQALDRRATLLKENPATYFLRATAYDHLRDKKQAAEYYHRFLEVAAGKFPDQEWQARHRLIAIEPK
ncbi:MAG TPA: tetratricopeptide repeat protein [Terriglobales bacterium]|nr:tetratricopeptide repeat protein [Terriglobales bacterium]